MRELQGEEVGPRMHRVNSKDLVMIHTMIPMHHRGLREGSEFDLPPEVDLKGNPQDVASLEALSEAVIFSKD